jgi:uncharacterized glyoxalase superfamily protein PhnB
MKPVKPVDLAKKLRRDAAVDPAALDRGKAELMAAIQQETGPGRRPAIVPQLPYENVAGALSFLQSAFGFEEVPSSRLVSAEGVVGHALVEFGGGVIGIGTQGAHGAYSPKIGGMESQYISIAITDFDAHFQRAVAAGAKIARGPSEHASGRRSYEAFDPEGHRWRFVQLPSAP